jgi:hypothetical protein
VVVFNFLLPTNGVSPIDPEDSTKYIATLGADADLAQIYIVVILLGMVLYTRAIVGLWLASPMGDARQRDDDWNAGRGGSAGPLGGRSRARLCRNLHRRKIQIGRAHV